MLDTTKITVTGGEGGNGKISFLRERRRPLGGPDGGDGGRGGDVIVVGRHFLRSLGHLEHVRFVLGEDGAPGGSRDRTGKQGKLRYVEVPLGTQVWDSPEGPMLADLVHDGDSIVVARGGSGGRGNHRFVSPSNQEPLLAEGGLPGTEHEIELVVKLFGDVGIVGVPNAGKSTLLSVVSRAKPKIGAYPFTTLEPNLGVASYRNQGMILVDIPGLISGAHQGKGLGLEFLRHIERVEVILHLVDGMAEELLAAYQSIATELEDYGHGLSTKPKIVAVTKQDIPEAKAKFSREGESLEREIGAAPLGIASVTGEGIENIIAILAANLGPQQRDSPQPPRLYEYTGSPTGGAVEITKVSQGYRVISEQAERYLKVINTSDWKTRVQYHAELGRLGVNAALNEAGVQEGDTVWIGELELEWE